MENIINAKTAKLKDFFAENKIECFQVEERNDESETAVFRSLMQVKGQSLPFAILLDKSVYALLQVQLAPALVKGEAFTKIAAFLNEMNNNYRVFKFVITNEGDLLLNACIVSKDDAFDPALVNAIIAETVKFLEAEYASIMAKVWEEIKQGKGDNYNKMKKKLITLLCSALMALGFSTSAFAGEIGFVDWSAVVASYPGIKEVAQEVVAEKTRLQAQFNEQAKALTTDKEKIELANKLNAQMAKFEQRKYEPINKKIRETILSVAQANKVDSVVNANAMIVGGKDLTKKVIAALKVQ